MFVFQLIFIPLYPSTSHSFTHSIIIFCLVCLLQCLSEILYDGFSLPLVYVELLLFVRYSSLILSCFTIVLLFFFRKGVNRCCETKLFYETRTHLTVNKNNGVGCFPIIIFCYALVLLYTCHYNK